MVDLIQQRQYLNEMGGKAHMKDMHLIDRKGGARTHPQQHHPMTSILNQILTDH